MKNIPRQNDILEPLPPPVTAQFPDAPTYTQYEQRFREYFAQSSAGSAHAGSSVADTSVSSLMTAGQWGDVVV
jgi:hypothetical protein